MMYSGSVLLLLPTAISAFNWNTFATPPVAPAVTTQGFNTGMNTGFYQTPVTTNAAAVTYPATTSTVLGTAPRTTNTQVASSLTGFNLGVASLCGKGPDGCAPLVSAQTIPAPVPAPAPRIFGNNPSNECDEFGGKSKGYRNNNPNCCAEGGKSKGYGGGNCGKSKGGKSGRSRTVSYEALASAATPESSFSWSMMLMGTSLVVAVSALLW